MRLLFVSDRPAGTFIMRGEQIARCRDDWRASLTPSPEDLAEADAVVIVKRVAPETLEMIRAAGLPVIYDALDFWPQPKARWRPRSRAQRIGSGAEALALFGEHFAALKPDLILCVTRQMAADLAPLGYPTEVIYHHADPRLPEAQTYARERPAGRSLIYLGNKAYLTEWEALIAAAAEAEGVAFTTLDSSRGGFASPPPASAMIAVRGGRDGCWISRSWKSNVKAATAAQLGLPLVAWPEAAYRETAPEAHFFDNPKSLRAAIAEATGPGARPLTQRFPVEAAAARYEAVIGALLAGEIGHLPGPAETVSSLD